MTRLSDEQGGVIKRQQELETLVETVQREQQRETALDQAMQACQDALGYSCPVYGRILNNEM